LRVPARLSKGGGSPIDIEEPAAGAQLWMFSKKRQIDPRVRQELDEIGEAVVRAKLSWIMNVTSLRSVATSQGEGGESLGDDLTAPLWAIEQWLAEKDARRLRWVKAAAILAGVAVLVSLLAWFLVLPDKLRPSRSCVSAATLRSEFWKIPIF
jgi:hypothetical protein